MAIDFRSGFTITSADPIDTRVVLSLSQMQVAHTQMMLPNNYFAVCMDDSQLYVYNASNTVSETSGKFRKVTGADIVEYIKSASVSGDVLTLTNADSTTVTFSIANKQPLIDANTTLNYKLSNAGLGVIDARVDTSVLPTADRDVATEGTKIVWCSTEPTNKYEGYIYYILA